MCDILRAHPAIDLSASDLARKGWTIVLEYVDHPLQMLQRGQNAFPTEPVERPIGRRKLRLRSDKQSLNALGGCGD